MTRFEKPCTPVTIDAAKSAPGRVGMDTDGRLVPVDGALTVLVGVYVEVGRLNVGS